MSKINIEGIVRDITTRTTYLTPLIEAICNSIDAIKNPEVGKIDIVIKREEILPEMGSRAIAEIKAIDIIDNGEGFTEENKESFDTYRSGFKYKQGGKGFGRFMYLKYFNQVTIESVYHTSEGFMSRSFRFGKRDNIIEDEIISHSQATESGTILHLAYPEKGKITDKGIEVIARKLLEKLLVFFVDTENPAPIITIREEDDSNAIILNDYIGEAKDIVACEKKKIELVSQKTGEVLEFAVQIYKIYHSRVVSSVNLTANKRGVTSTPLHKYIPEFEETLFEVIDGQQNNYSVQAYVIGQFLDDNVTVERDGFKLSPAISITPEETLNSEITETAIESAAADEVRSLFEEEMNRRYDEKKSKVLNYVNTIAPWNRSLLQAVDIESMPMGITEEELELKFQRAKYEKEVKLRIATKEIEKKALENDWNEEISEQVKDVCESISESSKNDLVHYICTRKKIIDLFDSLRKRREDGSSHLEAEMHNLIFPMGRNTNQIDFEDHNLWLLDERLVFSRFIASDQSNFKNDNEAPDLACFFNKRVLYRPGENNEIAPICIVEFKRPKRKNYGDGDNPILQALHYARKIQDGEYEMPDGTEPIKASRTHTPVYVYVVCDFVPKIDEFADDMRLAKSPDGERYFGFHSNYNAYIEVSTYKNLIESAKMRHAIFFKKLGL